MSLEVIKDAAENCSIPEVRTIAKFLLKYLEEEDIDRS